MSKLEICTNHTGKMEGVHSLSTSVLLNPFCQANRKILGSVCSHCYAENLAKMYSALAERLARNSKTLSSEIIKWEDLPIIKDVDIFRFEAFGDIINETHLMNYYHIVQANPFVRFTLYTKRYDLVSRFFNRDDVDVPRNLTIVFSSMMLNKPMDASSLKKPGLFYKGQVKTFTVYTKKFIKEHPEVSINCGARSCNTCRLCYLKNEVEEISEILKTDRDAAELYLAMKDPIKMEKIIDEVDAILEKYR